MRSDSGISATRTPGGSSPSRISSRSVSAARNVWEEASSILHAEYDRSVAHGASERSDCMQRFGVSCPVYGRRLPARRGPHADRPPQRRAGRGASRRSRRPRPEVARRAQPGPRPGADRGRDPRRRQPGGRGQPLGRAHGRAAGGPADVDPRRHRHAPVRLGHGGDRRGEPDDRGRRRVADGLRRRRVDEPRAVGDAQAGAALRAHARDDALDDARVAHGQPGHARRLDRVARRGRRDPGRPLPHRARRAGRVRGAQPPQRGGGVGPRRLRRRGRARAGHRARARRDDPAGLVGREARPGSSRRSARTAR